VYLLALKTNIPGELPSLEKIRDKVTADYKRSQALEMARNEGKAFQTAITNGLAQKKNFDEICAQAGIKPIKVPPFSRPPMRLRGWTSESACEPSKVLRLN